jgi:hypothetical protein
MRTAPDLFAAPPFFPCTNAVVHTCPRCAGSTYCEIRGRQLLQCRRCRHQTSLIAGTVLQGTKLPMRVWFRAIHLLAQGKKGLSNIELGRRPYRLYADSVGQHGGGDRQRRHLDPVLGRNATLPRRRLHHRDRHLHRLVMCRKSLHSQTAVGRAAFLVNPDPAQRVRPGVGNPYIV